MKNNPLNIIVKCFLCGKKINFDKCEVRSVGGKIVYLCFLHKNKAKIYKKNPAKAIRLPL